jgi:hypothetical protein
VTEFVDINLLPRPTRPRGQMVLIENNWRRPLLLGLGLMFVALFLLMAAYLQYLRNDRLLTYQQAELQLVGQQVTDLSVVQAEAEVLQEQLTTLATQADQLEGDAARVEQENPSLAPFLRAMADALLPRMTITGIIEGEAGIFLVQGEAGSNTLVTEYADALGQRPEIRAVAPRSVQQVGGDAPPGTVRWTLEVEREQ